MIGNLADGSHIVFRSHPDERQSKRLAERKAARMRSLLAQHPGVEIVSVDVWVMKHRTLPRAVTELAPAFSAVE